MGEEIRALEFFSGIGGLHYGLNLAIRSATVLCSFDINQIANDVYKSNFGKAPSTLDDEDERSKPLLHLVEVLSAMTYLPKYLFLENVPNFEKSRSRSRLLTALVSRGYTIHEFLLSPLQFGIPNDRRRYYLTVQIAKKTFLLNN
ncbi:tRNA (cytosine-5-)-methyltransferase [Phlyctochytrium planicorne]|nr:tRNA (cytosine-5-)-methyltransferase [Phlyctochytrium planicorne]